MNTIWKTSVSLALVLAAMPGCAADSTRYPSLALRPFETGAASPAPAPEPIRRVVLPGQWAEVLAAAKASHAAFLSQEAEVERLARAARGQSVGSNAHGTALVALADLDTRRAATAGTLAQIDALAAEAATALADDPALTAAQTDIAALLTREDAGLSRLWEMIGS